MNNQTLHGTGRIAAGLVLALAASAAGAQTPPPATMASDADRAEMRRLMEQLTQMRAAYAQEVRRLRDLDMQMQALQARLDADPADLRARHLLGVHRLVAGDSEAALEAFIELLRRDRDFEDGLPRKTLIDAFRIVDDAELVGRYRRRMASLLF